MLYFVFVIVYQALRPEFKVPSYETVRYKLIPVKKDQVIKIIKKKISGCRFLSSQIDLWASRSMDSYIGMWLSGVNENFESVAVLVACRLMSGRHTGEAIMDYFEEIIQSLQVNSKVNGLLNNNNKNYLHLIFIKFCFPLGHSCIN